MRQINKEKIGDRIAELRREKNLSQVEFANAMGVSLSSVSLWEQNKREPRLPLRDALCDFFNVDMNYLTGKSDVKNAFQSRGVMIKMYNLEDAKLDDEYIVDTMILPELFAVDKDCFAEMIEKSNVTKFGIMDDSVVILKETAALFNNTTQLVEIDGDYVLKRVTKSGSTVYLEDDNGKLEYSNRNDLKPIAKCALVFNME